MLVATPIGNLGDLSPRAVEVLRDAHVIAAEDTRRTRTLLTHAGVSARGRLVAVHEHNERQRAVELVDEIRRGGTVALVTDAGMPGVSDPGSRVARVCAEAGLRVDVVPGPSAALAALVVSGLPTDRFVFEGFLPRKGAEREDRLEAIEREERTVVIFESPRRIVATLEVLTEICGEDRLVSVSRELTKMFEETIRGTLGTMIDHFREHEPRGELVIVLQGGDAGTAAPSDEELAWEALALVRKGMSTREAADRLAIRFGVSRNRAYEVVLAQRSS